MISATEDIPGIALNSPSITLRMDSTLEIKRNIRKIRSIRRTENAPDAGTNEIATIIKSKIFHEDLKKETLNAISFRIISTVNIAMAVLSRKVRIEPYSAIIDLEDSTPRVIALNIITQRMKFLNLLDSTRFLILFCMMIYSNINLKFLR